MTILSPPLIIDRIKVATLKSPIAVFKTLDGRLDALFAATVITQRRIKAKDPFLLGVFHEGMDLASIKNKLAEWSDV